MRYVTPPQDILEYGSGKHPGFQKFLDEAERCRQEEEAAKQAREAAAIAAEAERLREEQERLVAEADRERQRTEAFVERQAELRAPYDLLSLRIVGVGVTLSCVVTFFSIFVFDNLTLGKIIFAGFSFGGGVGLAHVIDEIVRGFFYQRRENWEHQDDKKYWQEKSKRRKRWFAYQPHASNWGWLATFAFCIFLVWWTWEKPDVHWWDSLFALVTFGPISYFLGVVAAHVFRLVQQLRWCKNEGELLGRVKGSGRRLDLCDEIRFDNKHIWFEP